MDDEANRTGKGIVTEEGGQPPKKPRQDDSKSIPDAPELPAEFKALLLKLNFAGEFLVREWKLSEPTVGRNDLYYLVIRVEKLDRDGFLKEAQSKQNKLDFEVPLFVPSLGKFAVNLQWKSQSTYGLSNWNRIKQAYELAEGTPLQLWAFKNTKSSELGFALVIVDQEKLQNLKSARQIPQEFITRILGSEPASEEGAEIFYIVKKELAKSDVKEGAELITIPKKDIENNDFLRDIQETENSPHGITLIGPPDIEAVTVEVKWKPGSGLTISGAGWGKFARSYGPSGLEAGMQVKLWYFRRSTSSSTAKDSSLGFAMLRIEEGPKSSKKSDQESKNIADENPPPEGRQLLPDFQTQLSKFKFAGEVLVKEWVLSEENVSRKQREVIVPSKFLNRGGFLTEEQKQEADIEVPLLVAFLGKFTVNLRKKRDKASYGLTDWIRIMDKYKLTQGTQLQLWACKHEESSQLGFALVILTQEKLQGLRNARRIPEEIRTRIMGFGAASEEEAEIVFVMERILHKTDLVVGGGFTIPKKDIENDFLRNNEIETFVEGITLIGPPIQEPENREFKVKFTKAFSLTISGSDWRDFAVRYKLQPGMLVRLWSFRKPSSSSDNDSTLGFALVSPE